MAFPLSPTNGQQANVNGVIYIYSTTLTAWTVLTNTGANVSANNIAATNSITTVTASAVGNITGNYFIGNGSQLTGISGGGGGGSSIANGTSNVAVASSGGNVTIGIGGSANIAVFANNTTTIAGNIIPSANNVYSLGSPTAQWASVYVGNATLYLGNTAVSANNVTNTLLIGGDTIVTANAIGDSTTTGNMAISGNITSNYFVGNGSALTSITGANVTGTVGNASFAISASIANIAYSVSAANVIGTVANAVYAESAGVASVAYAVSGANVIGAVASATTAGTVTSNAQANITSVGTLTSLSVSGNATAGNIVTSGSSGNISGANVISGNIFNAVVVSATGNITGNYFIGNGSQLTGITPASSTYTRTSFTATGGQTTFSVTYTVGYVEVFLNGVLLNGADYTASNGTTVVLASGATAGDIVETIAYAITTIGAATSIAGGAASQIPYQSAAGTTAFIANGTAGQILTSNGTSAPTWSSAGNTTTNVGYLNIPQNIQTGSYTLVLDDAGEHIYRDSGGASTWTIPANSSVAYPIGTALTFINLSATSVSIAITTDTMYLSSSGTTGTRALSRYGSATAIKITSTSWIISGSGLT